MESLHPEKRAPPPLPRGVEQLRAKRQKTQQSKKEAPAPKTDERNAKIKSPGKASVLDSTDNDGRSLRKMIQALLKAVQIGKDAFDDSSSYVEFADIEFILQANMYREPIQVRYICSPLLKCANTYKLWWDKRLGREQCDNPNCQIAHQFLGDIHVIFLRRLTSTLNQLGQKADQVFPAESSTESNADALKVDANLPLDHYYIVKATSFDHREDKCGVEVVMGVYLARADANNAVKKHSTNLAEKYNVGNDLQEGSKGDGTVWYQ
jgi:hypothetical protein